MNFLNDCSSGSPARYPSDVDTAWQAREPVPNEPGLYRIVGNNPPQFNDPRFTPVRDLVIKRLKEEWFDTGKLALNGWCLGYNWDTVPDIMFLPNSFWVPTGRDGSANGGGYSEQGVCADGLADYQNFIVKPDGSWEFHPRIVVSYRQSAHVAALVAWETANYVFEATGRSDWSDKHGVRPDGTFSVLKPDSGWIVRRVLSRFRAARK